MARAVTPFIISLLKMQKHLFFFAQAQSAEPVLLRRWCRVIVEYWVTGRFHSGTCICPAWRHRRGRARVIVTHNRWIMTGGLIYGLTHTHKHTHPLDCTLRMCVAVQSADVLWTHAVCLLIICMPSSTREREREWDRSTVQGYRFNLAAVVMWLIVARGQGMV